jgi:hypothetical protein
LIFIDDAAGLRERMAKISAARVGASPAREILNPACDVSGSACRLAYDCARNTSNGDLGVSSPMVNLLPYLN